MNVFEFFSSIQGESSFAGYPCFFIRLSACNLKCSYCDTADSQDINNGKAFTIDQIIEKAELSGIKLVEITGGEPLLQKNVIPLCRKLLKKHFKILIETNGTYPVKDIPDPVNIIMDCKTPSSGYHKNLISENFNFIAQNDEVKFVIVDRNDYLYAKNIIDEFALYKKTENILLSPVLKKLEAKKLAEWILEDKIKCRLNLQVHKFIWGFDAQGV